MRINWLTCMFRGLRASSSPQLTLNPPKCRPIASKCLIFGVFCLMGLHFGEHTASCHGLTAANRGELHYMRV